MCLNIPCANNVDSVLDRMSHIMIELEYDRTAPLRRSYQHLLQACKIISPRKIKAKLRFNAKSLRAVQYDLPVPGQ